MHPTNLLPGAGIEELLYFSARFFSTRVPIAAKRKVRLFKRKIRKFY